jgi:hypothetical protein
MLSSCWLRGSARRLLGRGLVATFAWSVGACSVLVNSDRQQCATDGDCQQRGGAFAKAICANAVCITEPKWGCVGTVVWPIPPPVASPEKVTVKLALSNLVTSEVVIGAAARVCGKLDPKCDTPLQVDVLSNDEGTLTVQLNKFFDGYLEIKFPGMVDTIYTFNPPVEKDRVVPFVPLVPFTALEVFGKELKMLPQPDRGTVIGLTYDCLEQSAEGIQLSTDEADDLTAPFYMAAGFPSLEATMTDKSGQGGIANVPVGARLISGRRADTGELIGTVSVQTRAIWITYTSMLPTPLSTPK